jgi:hypothetical protein
MGAAENGLNLTVMKTKTLMFLIAAALLIEGVQKLSAATVPEGTILIVRTLRAVASTDVPGTPVPTQLERAVMVNGKVAIPAGTQLGGKVVTSRRLASSNAKLTVDLTTLHLAGHDAPITTTGPQFVSNDFKTRRNVGVSRTDYTVAAGKSIRFKLARPLTF